jgi:predicted aldo/keto reductase-like oxidoreductase
LGVYGHRYRDKKVVGVFVRAPLNNAQRTARALCRKQDDRPGTPQRWEIRWVESTPQVPTLSLSVIRSAATAAEKV